MSDIFYELLDEVRNMTTDEYIAYHKEALLMKQNYDNMIIRTSLFKESCPILKEVKPYIKSYLDQSTSYNGFKVLENFDYNCENEREDIEWQIAA